MKKRAMKLPEFKSEAQEAEFWDKHSIAPYWKSMKQAKFKLQRPVKHMISIRMGMELFEKIRQVAEAKGLPYQTMMRQWLTEKVEEELPSLRQPYVYGSGYSLGVGDR